MLSYFVLPFQKATLLLIPFHFTIPPTSKNSIFIKIIFFNIFFIIPFHPLVFLLGMIPTAPPSPHHHHTTPQRLHHHRSPQHHLRGSTIINHHTTTKMLLPLIIHITQLENPNLFQQARSH